VSDEARTAIIAAVWTLCAVYITYTVAHAVLEIRAAKRAARRLVAEALKRRAEGGDRG
jgi:hypothetical protein